MIRSLEWGGEPYFVEDRMGRVVIQWPLEKRRKNKKIVGTNPRRKNRTRRILPVINPILCPSFSLYERLTRAFLFSLVCAQCLHCALIFPSFCCILSVITQLFKPPRMKKQALLLHCEKFDWDLVLTPWARETRSDRARWLHHWGPHSSKGSFHPRRIEQHWPVKRV